jgi:hypothetical protein
MYMNGRDTTSGTAIKMNMSRQDGTKFIKGKKIGAPAQAIMRMFKEIALNRTASCIPPNCT